jgi:pristinamycin I synthase 3 and 4
MSVDDRHVMIRGRRVALAEIEAALREQPGVKDAVVLARGEEAVTPLLAYVTRHRDGAGRADTRDEQIELWRALFDTTYADGSETTAAGDFRLDGWRSSYTGGALAVDEMRVWLDETERRVRALGGQRLLDVGCGTGLLLTRLAAAYPRYVGIDFSEPVIDQLREYADSRPEMRHVELRQGSADDLSFLEADSIDVVVLNSVVQYFPDVEYLLAVLDQAFRVTRRGGWIFVGDVRSLPLVEAYHTSVQLHRSASDVSVDELRQRITEAKRQDEELLLDSRVFEALLHRQAKLGRVMMFPKSGAYDNELSRFRYDVLLHVEDVAQQPAAPDEWAAWDPAGQWRDTVTAAIRAAIAVGVRGIPDARTAQAVAAARLLRDAEWNGSTVGALRAAVADVSAEDLNVVMRLAADLGVELLWHGPRTDGVYDAVFNPRWESAPTPPRDEHVEPCALFANTPLRHIEDREWVAGLQQGLRARLLDDVIPAVTVVDELPAAAGGDDRVAVGTTVFN